MSAVPRGAVILEAMNPLLVVVLVVGATAVLPAQTTQDVLATAAATLFEGTPFILAATVLGAGLTRRLHWAIPFLGCGCGEGPAARSLPAAVATWLAFGPAVALARAAAAAAVAVVLCRSAPSACVADAPPRVHGSAECLSAFYRMLPFGLAAGAISHLLPWLVSHHGIGLSAPMAGALLGFFLAPCGLGVVGVAGALRATAPGMLGAFLCVAGIFDIRSLQRLPDHCGLGHDTLAYGLSSAACAIAAAHDGATLLHPRFVIPLWCCAAVLLVLAITHRHQRDVRALAAPGLMFAVAFCGAPPPDYHATMTTLADAFPGERLQFVGIVTRDRTSTALVRYAITCCRADAAPVVVRLVRDVRASTGSWLSAVGTLEGRAGALELRVVRAAPIAPPTDPYVYR
jgi:hypothetical protein